MKHLSTLLTVGLLTSAWGTALAQGPWETPVRGPFSGRRLSSQQLQMQAPGMGSILYREDYGRQQYGFFMAHTLDNGQTWQETPLNLSSPFGWMDYWVLPTGAFYVISATGTDPNTLVKGQLGTTSVSVAFSNISASPFAVRFFDNNTGLMLTRNANQVSAYRTIDAGVTWTPQASALSIPSGQLVKKLEVVGNNVWFITSTGNVWRSTDQGQTWAMGTTGLASLAPGWEPKVCASDANHALAWSLDGVVKRTTDGGVTWTAVTTNGPIHYRDIVAVPNRPGTLLSGGFGVSGASMPGLSLSTDYGITWQALNTSFNLGELQAQSATQVWAVDLYYPPQSGGWPDCSFLRMSSNVLATQPGAARLAPDAYPNPTSGRLQVPGAAGYTARLFDATGRLAFAGTVAGDAVLDLSGCRPGLYRVQLIDKKGATSFQQIAVTR